MSTGAIAAAAALMAHGMANAKSGENWHQRNQEKSKERQAKIKDKYKALLSKDESELMAALTEGLSEITLPESKKKCPECRQHFSLLDVADLELDVCRKCHSFWFDAGELLSFVHTTEDVPSKDLTSRASKYRCPICQKRMRECVYQKPHNLLVDHCSDHGVYLENKELDRVVEITREL